jgi:hypothetical protein
MYPDHLFFFGEKAIQLLLDQTSFECIRIYRWNIMLNLILERALWRFNDAIKQKNVDMTIRAAEENAPISNKDNKLGFKRRIRMLYRHVGAFLSHLGAIMPKDGRPLKLIIVARKK